MRREDVEHLLAVGLPAARFDQVSEHDLLSRIVDTRLEDEAAALTGIGNRPAREGTRDFRHVLLRIPAVDAERVQLHQLAAVVLVQPFASVLALGSGLALALGSLAQGSLALGSLALGSLALGSDPTPPKNGRKSTPGGQTPGRGTRVRPVRVRAHPVVEIEQHRRALGG